MGGLSQLDTASVHNTGHLFSTDPYRSGVSRPVKSRSYRHNGRTHSIHRCCYECQKSNATDKQQSLQQWKSNHFKWQLFWQTSSDAVLI